MNLPCPIHQNKTCGCPDVVRVYGARPMALPITPNFAMTVSFGSTPMPAPTTTIRMSLFGCARVSIPVSGSSGPGARWGGWKPPAFTPFDRLGTPVDLVRRFGPPRQRRSPWSILACAASSLILGFFRRSRRVTVSP